MTFPFYDNLHRSLLPSIPSGPELPFRDVRLLDLARYAAMKAPFDLHFIQGDTAELHDALKAEADRLGAAPDSDPEPSLDALEPFALAWARDRAAERAAHLGAGA